jgi:hypothetical protein
LLVNILLIAAISLPVCLGSCDEAATTIPDTTRVLDETTLNGLSAGSVNSSTLSFDNITGLLSSLSVGDVIVCGVSNVTPYGLLRKVTNIAAEGNQMTVETVKATLEDAIEQCTIDGNWHLEPDGDFVPLETQETSIEDTASAEAGGVLTATPLASGQGFYRHIDDVPLYDGITADIWASGDLDFDIGFTIRRFKLTACHFIATDSMTSQLELLIGINHPAVQAKRELYRHYFSPLTIMVGVVPVVVVPILTINVGLDGEVTAGMTVGVTETSSVTAGLQYSDGKWSKIADFSISHEWQRPELTAGCEVKAYVGLQVNFLLYNVAGPYGEIRGYLELDADMYKTPWWELYGGVEADVGFRMEVLGREIVDYELPLAIGWRTLLAQAETAQAVMFPDPNLEAAIREAIGKPSEDIYASDLEGLTYLDASDRGISDLTGLEYCVRLGGLDLWGNDVSDLSPLANLTGLGQLGLTGNPVADISPLAGLTNLEVLYVNGSQITDISPLAGLTKLENLMIDANQISDILPLAGLTSLSYLDLSDNQIVDISPLASLTSLEELSAYENQIEQLSPLAGLTSLTTLWLDSNQITDISPLAGLSNLKWLGVDWNQISDILPLAGLTTLELLDLYGNQISDVSPLVDLTGLTNLDLGDNQVGDISPLVDNTGLGEGDEVALYGNPLSEDSISIYIPELLARGVTVQY